MPTDGADSRSSLGEDQREMMELLSQETRHSIVMAILGHPHHLTSRTELEEMVSKSSGAIDDAIGRLQDKGLIGKYKTKDPDNPNKRDYPTTFWGPTANGIRIFHEYNYLRLLPAQRALYDSSTLSETMERHLEAERPNLPESITEALAFDEGPVAPENEQEPLFAVGSETIDYGEYTTNSEDQYNPPSNQESYDNGITSYSEIDGIDSGLSSIIKSALEAEQHAETESSDQYDGPRIVVVGCGGAGNSSVNRLYNIGVDGAELVSINTDRQHLETVGAETKILVGKSLTNGLGAGGDPAMGKRAAEMSQGNIKQVLDGADLVFVTAGMGGGTGTGAAPVISKIAKEQGAIVVGMVSTPFNVERARIVKAEEGLERLRKVVDSIIVLDNNRLLNYVPNLPIGKAFSVMDQIIAETVKGISETITQPSLINLDYADMKAIMNQSGLAVMLVGETQDKNKTEEVVKDALNHPLLDVDYRGASGGLVLITGGPDLKVKEVEGIAQNITDRLEASANVICGARIKENYEGKIRITAIMTGVQSDRFLSPETQNREFSPATRNSPTHFNTDDSVDTNVINTLIRSLESEQVNVQTAALKSLSEQAETHPTAVAKEVPEMFDRLSLDDEEVRKEFLSVLITVSKSEPQLIADELSEIEHMVMEQLELVTARNWKAVEQGLSDLDEFDADLMGDIDNAKES